MWDITKLERIGIKRQVCEWTTKLSKPGFQFGENSGKRKHPAGGWRGGGKQECLLFQCTSGLRSLTSIPAPEIYYMLY